jgi:hypothetical protein
VTCPQCGSAAAVHSVAEWAAMASGPMGGSGPAYGPQPGYGPAPQPGYPAGPGPQSGFPDPSQYQQSSGFPDPSRYQQPGFPDPSQDQQPGFPDPSQDQQPGFPSPPQDQPPASPAEPPAAPRPGYTAGTQTGPPSGEPRPNQPPPRRSGTWYGIGDSSSFEEGVADAVLGAATKAIGRAIGRRMRQAYNERVVPAMAARQEALLRERMAIAQRHPDLCACLNDQVIFLAGGTRALPLASALAVRTVEQSDALVAQLRGG